MSTLGRREAVSAFAGIVAAALGSSSATAQVAQEVVNVASVVATGNVNLEQDAAGSVYAEVGISRGPSGIQIVSNDGRVVATGDVNITQRASGSMDVSSGDVGICEPGDYYAADGALRFCDINGCWQTFACQDKCRKGRC